MAQATYTVTQGTSSAATGVNVAWRKIQGKVAQGAQFMFPEWQWYDDYPEEDIDWSLRETTIPLDIDDAVGAGYLPEGGKLMRPSSVNMTDLTVPLSQLNARWTASKLAKYANRGMTNQVEAQLRYQATKKLQALVRLFARSTYGTSVGTIALTDTDVPAATSVNDVALKDAFGKTDVDNAAYLVSLFKVNDRVAFVDNTSLVGGSFGYVDALDVPNGQIDITFDTTATNATTANLKIVGAASLENTTIAGTDYGIALNGWVDFLTAATLHGVATATYPAWAAGADAGGGRLDRTKLMKAEHTIQNNGGGRMDRCLLSQGVWRDLDQQTYSLVRYDSPKGMELDGTFKMAGVEFKTSRYMLPQHAICYDRKSVRKLSLLPKPDGGASWGDGKELIDDDGFVFEINMACGLFNTNRGNLYYFSALTES